MGAIDKDILKFYEELAVDAFTGAEVIIRCIQDKQPELFTKQYRKQGNKDRQLLMQSKYTKSLQASFARSVGSTIFPQFSAYSTGGIPGKSRENAVRIPRKAYRNGRRVVLKMDLQGAFSNVDHAVLREELLEFLPEWWVDVIFQQWITPDVIDKNGVTSVTVKGIPPGMPISPLFFNLLLDKLDKFCEEQGYLFYRHADDLASFFETEKQANKARKVLAKFIDENIKIPLNLEKCSITKIEEAVLLGYASRGKQLPGGKSKLIMRPSRKNQRGVCKRILERLQEYQLNKNPHALFNDLERRCQQWYDAFPSSNDRRFIKAFDRWLARQIVKAVFFTFTDNTHARYRHYKKLLGSSKVARELASLNLSEAEATLKQLLSCGKLTEFPLALK